MIRRFEHYNSDAWNPKGLRRSFVASVALHAGAFGLILLLVWSGHSRMLAPGAKVAFIPRGHHQGAIDDPNAAAVAATPQTTSEPPAPAPKPPDPTPPKSEDKPKPPEPPPVKQKEPDKPKLKDTKESKVKENSPPKPKPDEKKAKDTPKDKAEKTAEKKTKDKTGQSKNQKLALADMIPPSDETAPKGKGAVKPQQGQADGEEKLGVEIQEGLPGVLTYWIGQVQRKVKSKWETPEGVLIVPDQNAAQIGFIVNRKGELVGQPEIVKEASDPVVAQSGLKAVLDSAPLPPLPDDFEENQQQVIITFRLVR
ncbi:MAG: TonB C-terminal domain-containing protein [Candidatus Hydrogenedentes bacterium]|nr:TonB C-terminal domain-containing protein [Candidatus Hydrogenedentota bacterium]